MNSHIFLKTALTLPRLKCFKFGFGFNSNLGDSNACLWLMIEFRLSVNILTFWKFQRFSDISWVWFKYILRYCTTKLIQCWINLYPYFRVGYVHIFWFDFFGQFRFLFFEKSLIWWKNKHNNLLENMHTLHLFCVVFWYNDDEIFWAFISWLSNFDQ